MTESKQANARKSKNMAGKPVLVTARHAVIQEMHRRGECRAAEVSADLGLKETTVSSIIHGLYVHGHAERVERGVYRMVSLPENFKPTKGKLDVRKIRRPIGPTMPAQLITLLQAAPDHTLPFEFIRNNTNLSRQETGAVLSDLVKRGVLNRPRRGVYSLIYKPKTQEDREDAVLRYIADRPWSRAAEIQRGANLPVTADMVRKFLARASKAGKIKRDGFCYALPDEKRSTQECRNARQALQAPEDLGPRRAGRPPKTRIALLNALRAFTQPRSVETLADSVGLSVDSIRSLLADMVQEGLVLASKLRTDREDMRLVYHYELARDDQGQETKKPKRRRKGK
jgi:hypothetical protein